MRNETIKISFNTCDMDLDAGSGLKDLLDKEVIVSPEIALIALNGSEGKKENYDRTLLHNGDSITVFYLLGGS